MRNYLLDKDFLLKLDNSQTKIAYAKIISLDLNDRVQEEITGKITSGSVNIDGESAIRRTCSLSMVAEQVDLTSHYWTLKTKFRLEIGLQNTIDSQYSDIIWFDQGIYLISSFNASLNTNSFSISIQGKDKMAKLNGDFGGNFSAETIFDSLEEVDITGKITKVKIPIKEIITKLLHEYAGEPYHNIIIEDLPDYGYSLLEYRGNDDTGMYIILNNDNSANNLVIKGDEVRVKKNKEDENSIPLKELKYNTLNNLTLNENSNIDRIWLIENKYGTVLKPQFGQAIAYERTELTYAGDLIAKAGETITSILDKIKNMLGQYEYFYDTEGRFIFRQKLNYVQITYSPIKVDADNDLLYVNNNEYGYNFTDNTLITQISNNPQILNIKNDFTVWGTREGVSGGNVPIHIRIAIDEKPISYNQITFTEKDKELLRKFYPDVVKKQEDEKQEDFEKRNWIDNRNPQEYISNTIDCDWREVIYQMADEYTKCALVLPEFNLRVATANPELYPTGVTGYEQYYSDILGFWRQLYDGTKWTDAIESPETLNFWFDFLDGNNSTLAQYSVKTIGDRTKVVNDNTVKTIYYRETPNILFSKETTNNNAEFTELKINDQIRDLFTISSQGKSAYTAVEELISKHSNAAETISLTTIPIYYLEPNTIIEVSDKKTNIEGKYLMTKISYQIGYNATMSLTCSKLQETLL